MRLILITGISRGLGASLFNGLVEDNNNYIIGIGRTFTDKQIQLSKDNQSNVDIIYYDFETQPNLNLQKETFMKFNDIVFINNAGSIDPICKVGFFNSIEKIQRHVNVNYISLMYLLDCIVSLMDEKSHLKVLNISSGAAERPLPGWSLYCSTKKAAKTFLEVLNLEYKNVSVFHIDPGIMDTGMQKMIRGNTSEDFPLVDQFKEYYLKGQLLSPNDVAANIIKEHLK